MIAGAIATIFEENNCIRLDWQRCVALLTENDFQILTGGVHDVLHHLGSCGVSNLAADEQPGGSSLKSAVHGTIGPLSRYARLALVLRYMPCVVVAIATHQEIGSWQWFGVAFAAACRDCRQTMASRLAMGISPLDCLGQNTRTPLFFNNN